MRNYFSLLLIGFSHFSNSQNIEGLSLYQEGNDLVISFDLKPVRSINELYDISIVSSMDGYQNPINLKVGSILEISPGNSLTYIIDGEAEFKGYKGDLNFRVTAELAYSPLQLITEKITAKRGKTVNLRWEGGYRNENYNIELYKNETRISSLASRITTTSTLWTIANDNPVGGGYTVKISSGTDPSKNIVSPTFSIKRKVPLGLKIFPIIAAGGVVGVLSGGSGGGDPGSGGGGSGGTVDDLPGPPIPPGG